MDLEWIFPFQSYGETSGLSWGKHINSRTKGTVWREQRKLFHSQFQESVAPDYMQLQVKSAQDVARKILASPDDLLEHLHLWVSHQL